MAGSVKFYRGSYEVYELGLAEGKYTDGIFFDENRYTIFLNGLEYGGSADVTGAATKEWVNEHYGDAFHDLAFELTDIGGFTVSFLSAYDDSTSASINIPIATLTSAGLLSKEDKAKINSFNSDNFVKVEEGKGLSSNDYTTDEKEKLANIEGNAQINKIEVIKINGVTQEIVEKVVDLDILTIVDNAVKTAASSTYQYRGTVSSASELPSTNLNNGDVYNIEQASLYGAAGVNVAWNQQANSWDSLGGVFSTADLELQIAAVASDVTSLDGRLDTLEGLNLNSRLNTTETEINIFKGSDTTSGSIKYIAKEMAETVINNTLTWEVL